MTVGYRDFEFNLPEALLARLVDVLDGMDAAPLDSGGLAAIPEAQGVYQLFLDGEVTYIGKTDAEAGLARRLSRHSRKILHRQGLEPSRVTFKAVRIFVFTAMDLETQLIRRYTGKAGTRWNGSGFGANDPGRERDTTKPGKYDSDFPIDIDRPLDIDLFGEMSAAEVVIKLKAALPYTLRFQSASKGSRQPHQELAETTVTMTSAAHTPRTALIELTKQLPAGWQATVLSALLILYKEHKSDYPKAEILARS